MTINHLKELFFQDFIAHGYSFTSMNTYNGFLRKFIQHLEGLNVIDPKVITSKDIKDYLRDVRNARSGEPLANRTRSLLQSSIKSFSCIRGG